MFGKKKKNEQEFTPEDLQKLNKDNTFTHYGAKKSAQNISKAQKWKRRSFILLIFCVGVLLIMYLVSMLLTQWGDLVISVDSKGALDGLQISDTKDFEHPQITLNAQNVKDVTNITYDWLPNDLDSKDGSHNGSNYLAYTFYVKNSGSNTIDYNGVLNIKGVAKNMDEAVRIMVYKNGKPAIYAKKDKETGKAEKDATEFENDTDVMKTQTTQMKPGDIDKYTVVSWVEGNDPQCVDDIMGGYMRMAMLFSVADAEV